MDINSNFSRYSVFNENSLDTVVLLHGYADDSNMFDRYIKDERNQRLIAINFPMNMPNTEAKYNTEQLAKYVIDILDELKIQDFSICGFSLGGIVAIEIANTLPERVKEIQLLSSYPLLVRNKTVLILAKILKPLVALNPCLYLISRINTNKILRQIAKSPKVSDEIIQRMRKNYKSIFGTVINIICYDGREKYKSFKGRKYIHIFKDDTVIKLKSVSKKSLEDNIPINIVDYGGHGEGENYFECIV
jgi:esterase/lipase